MNYQLTYTETALALFTLSGLPYALRHWEVANRDPAFFWEHRIIAVMEATPIFGGVVAIFDRMILKDLPSPPVMLEEVVVVSTSWQPRAMPRDAAFKKMWKNGFKAIEERKGDTSQLPSIAEMLRQPTVPLAFTFLEADTIGRRRFMEDCHFYREFEEGALAAVFDGHGGHQVARLAAEAFQELFLTTLAEREGNVHQTFEILVHDIQTSTLEEPMLDEVGSTGVICYMDKKTHLVYTATIGDCEAYIFRNNIPIPLSCLRNWAYEKEAQRVEKIFKDHRIDWPWQVQPDAKKIYFPHRFHGVNVSRAFGDKVYHFSKEEPGIIYKPKITVNRMNAGDRLILACDGLWDFATLDEVGEQIDYPDRLVDYVINYKHGLDNVSVIVVTAS